MHYLWMIYSWSLLQKSICAFKFRFYYQWQHHDYQFKIVSYFTWFGLELNLSAIAYFQADRIKTKRKHNSALWIYDFNLISTSIAQMQYSARGIQIKWWQSKANFLHAVLTRFLLIFEKITAWSQRWNSSLIVFLQANLSAKLFRPFIYSSELQ